MAQCKAKSKRTGERCKQPAMHGREVCYMHGGKTPRGKANANTAHGKYSKHLPTQYAAIYEELQADKELDSIRGEIQLIDVLIMQALPNLDTGESGAAWEEMLRQVIAARRAYKGERYGDLEAALDEMEAVADNRRLHYATEKEIRDNIEQRRKLVDTQRKMELAGEKAITAEQLVTFLSAIMQLITTVIDDRAKRDELLFGIDRLLAPRQEPITIGTKQDTD